MDDYTIEIKQKKKNLITNVKIFKNKSMRSSTDLIRLAPILVQYFLSLFFLIDILLNWRSSAKKKGKKVLLVDTLWMSAPCWLSCKTEFPTAIRLPNPDGKLLLSFYLSIYNQKNLQTLCAGSGGKIRR